MTEAIKRITIKEFREKGFLQELNRQFLHPLGMALEVLIEEDGTESLGGIWDYREDAEGMFYNNDLILEDRVRYVAYLKVSKVNERIRVSKGLGLLVDDDGIQLPNLSCKGEYL